MVRHWRYFAGIALALALATPASANDRFTGPYIGAHIGYAFSAAPDKIGVRDVATNAFIDTYGDIAPSGALGGLGLGYTTRSGGLLVGVDLDASLGKISDTEAVTKSGLTVSSKGDQMALATLRGRVGVPVSTTAQIFATAGLAVAKYDYSIAYAGILNGTLTRNVSTAGWTLGGGAEWAIDQKWSVKAEYLYLNLMKAKTITDGTISTIEHLQQSQIRLGLNHKF
jgi:outer membrane immunogenic protein